MKPEEAQLLESIETLLGDNENSIMIPMTRLNQGIAQLSVQNAKAITRIQNKLVKEIDQGLVGNNNELDRIGTSVLSGLQDWQLENNLLLTQLAAKTGLTQPGDPLEAALVAQVAEAPEMAYSASLLLALRDALPILGQLVEVLREIRDRMPAMPVHVPGEPRSIAPAAEEPWTDDVNPDADLDVPLPDASGYQSRYGSGIAVSAGGGIGTTVTGGAR